MRVHLIDGTYELFRTFYGAPPARASDGREVGATRILARRLLKHARIEAATHVGVAFDHVIESFRNDLFLGYKTGEGLDPELTGQFELAEEVTRALGFVVWPMVEFEADDALATAAARFARDPRVTQVRILSPDKDFAQCVNGERIVTVHDERVLDEAGVCARFGIPPVSIPDYLALVGGRRDPGARGLRRALGVGAARALPPPRGDPGRCARLGRPGARR
jgi:5'-3' exonuclease